MATLENVKVGDKLKVRTHYEEYIETIERKTNTLVITKYHRFIKKTGKAQGSDSWSYVWAEPATPEDIERISKAVRRKKLIYACESIKFSGLLEKQMEMILEIANQNID